MLTSLHIQNFRAFRDLKLEGLRRVNLVAGGNNVGKTALLEGLVLALMEFGSSSIRDLPKLFRSTQPDQSQFLEYWDWILPMPVTSSNCLFAGKENGKEFGVGYDFSGRSNPEGVNEWWPVGQLGRHHVLAWLRHGERPPQKAATFSTFPTDPRRDAFDYNRVILKKRRKQVERLLGEVEPRLVTVESLQANGIGPMLYADVGLPELIPVTQLGQGFNRLLDIYSELVAEDAKVLLIDEIENGLYWKALPVVWKGLFAAARELDIQIFATTHSLECIKAADEAARAGGDYDLAVIRLDRVGDDIQPTVMGEEAMRTAKEFGWEIR